MVYIENKEQCDLNPIILIIMLNVNGLKHWLKVRVSDCIRQQEKELYDV